MNPLLSTFLLAVLMALALPADADTLRGQLSGLEDPDAQVDLRVRFFPGAAAERLLFERQFPGVSLRGGRFAVPLASEAVPPGARFVEIALRPSARPYAAFRGVPPRRRLQRLPDGTLVAAATAGSPLESRFALSADPAARPRAATGDSE